MIFISGRCKLILLVMVGALLLPHAASGQDEAAPPNVVFVIADQMRGDAMGVVGNPNVRTPNLDRMAAEGAVFRNFFVNNPVCVPSRQSFFSGLYPHQHGSLANIDSKRLSSLDGTMLGYFRDSGYRTGYIGKNHTYEDDVLESLDVYVERGREPSRRYNEYVPPHWHADSYWPEEQLHPHLTTQDGIAFLRSAEPDEPFFLTLSYFDPHPPYFAPSGYANRYDANEMVVPTYIPPERLSGRLAAQQKALHYDRISRSDLTATMKYYYASIEWGVDHQIGRILEVLDEEGIAENTIVVFTSEHGDFMGDHRMVRKGMFLYDALLHVPLVWYAPGRIRAGLRSDAMSQGIDLFPTLVDMTGGAVPETLPGRSLKPLLDGQVDDQDDVTVFASAAYSELPDDYFDAPEPAHYNPPKDSDVPFHTRVERLTWKPENKTVMARTRDWKVILNETRPPELYHMAGGWVEQENVAGDPAHNAVLERLRSSIRDVWTWE